MSEEQSKERHEFEFRAEVQQILSLVINSLYTNSEIFLRELVSNASDALDKARFLRLTSSEASEQQGEPRIELKIDAESKSITIDDNGVGMTREEAIENLGTIARSGTSEFLRKVAELGPSEAKGEDAAAGALELIGQFGVGFYSVFMVAARVDVQTRSMLPGAEPVLWRSSGTGSFTVLPGDREHPGTTVTVHLKSDAAGFAQPWRVKELVRKYSDFVLFPIRLDGETVNRSAALWRQPKNEVSVEQHKEFYQHLTAGRLGEEPLSTLHYSIDAPVQFSALVYVPAKAWSDLFTFHKQRPGLRLYAHRVLVMENCDTLTPGYLRFLRGVVDSEDLPLNVSRETLQENRRVKQIEQQLTKQVLRALEQLAQEEPERYARLWKLFGQVLKEGVATDWKNQTTLVDLCRFETMKGGPDKLCSFRDYLASKPESQSEIYYLTGPSRQQLERSPHLEAFRQHDRDVLFLTDPVDEWLVQSLPNVHEHPLKSVAHGQVDLGAAAAPPADELPLPELEAALEAIRRTLGEKVREVRASTRLTETASCLVAAEGDPGANLERLMKMMDDGTQERKRILEVNPRHPLVRNLGELWRRDPASSHIALWAEMLHDQALLSEGVVEDPARLVRRIQDLLVAVSDQVVKPKG
jgi:molecular chaperone HtpG